MVWDSAGTYKAYGAAFSVQGGMAVKMFNLCEECDRLWKEYAAATAEHILCKDRWEKSRNFDSAAALIEKVEVAGALRERARLAIQHHELSVHLGEGRKVARAAG